MTTYPVGLIEGITEVIGEGDTELGGLYMTRLTAPITNGEELTAEFVWDGTTVILSSDTTEVAPGDWIRLDADGRYFQIVSEVPNVSVTIENPEEFPIPTGGGSGSPSSKAVISFPVETTHDWADSGQIGIDGVRYNYGSKTDTSFDDVSYTKNGDYVPGAARQHRIESPVLDLNRDRSALDRARRAMLVEYAEGDDLNALGRNLGVLRLPFLASDEVFRNIVKTLAYNPKGTIYGIQQALTGLVGAGNFEVYEDVLNFPNTVFIRLVGAAATDNQSEGKTYLTDTENQPATGNNTVDVDEDLITNGIVGGVRWKDENHTTDCRSAYPSVDSIEEYEGDPGTNPFTLAGTGVSEGTHVTNSGSYTEFTQSPPTDRCWYEHGMRIQPESMAEASILATVPVGGSVDAADTNTVMLLDDTEVGIIVGIKANDAAHWQVGITAVGSFFGGPAATFLRGTWHEITVRKDGRNYIELLVDGVVVQAMPYASLSPSSLGTPNFAFGHFLVAAANKLRVKQVSYFARTLTDYFSARGSSGVLSSGPEVLDTNVSGLFDSGDIGKSVVTQNTTPGSHVEGGNNNGRWEVVSVPASDSVELIGPTHPNATVQAANPTRIVVPAGGELFQYPDDLGKKVEILNSSLGNNGSWVIGTLREMGTLVDLDSYATKLPTKTNVAELVGASFVTEPGLNWRILPNFQTESNVEWVVAGMGSMVGNTITLPQNLPISSSDARRILAVVYSQVLSAQVLLDASIENAVQGGFPVTWEYYPFYLADPLGYVRQYLEEITAAGVIADFQIV